jgi:hypothetical protein
MKWFVKFPFTFLCRNGKLVKKYGDSKVVGSTQKQKQEDAAEFAGPFNSRKCAELSKEYPSLYPNEQAASEANFYDIYYDAG